MISRIDRYISALYLSYFLAGILAFVCMFFAVDALTTMVNYKNVATDSLLRYYLFYLPEIVYKMIPIACVMGLIFAISNLQKHGELTALFSCGMSLTRITMPIIILTATISVLGYQMADQMIPSFAKKKNFVFFHEIKKKPGQFSTVKTGRIWYRSKNILFNIKTINSNTKVAEGVTLYYFDDDWFMFQMIIAQKVQILDENWNLQNGSITVFSKENSFPLVQDFKSKKIMMDEDVKDLTANIKTSDMLSQKDLKQYITKNRDAGLDTGRYEVDYQSKLSAIFTAIVMVLLSIPFVVGKARGGGVMAGLSLCFGLIVVYWILNSSFLTLGYYGQIPPFLAAWSPQILMGSVAAMLLLRIKK